MRELIFVVEEAPEGGYTARALGESIFTEAESLEELRVYVRDAAHCHFEDGKIPGQFIWMIACRQPPNP